MNHMCYQTSLARGRFRKPEWGGCFLAAMLLASFGIAFSAQAQECGTVWTESNIGPRRPGSAYSWAAASNGSRWICAGLNVDPDNPENRIWSSDDDGVNWTSVDPILPAVYGWRDVASDGSQFVVTGHAGMIITSPDGLTWTTRSTPTTAYIRRVLWDGNRFVAGTDSGQFLRSTDGATWLGSWSSTKRSMGLCYGNGLYVSHEYQKNDAMLHPDPRVYTSTDAINWTLRGDMGNVSLCGTAYGKGRYIIAGRDKSTLKILVLNSSDGITWTRSPTPSTTGWLNDVKYNGHLFIAPGGGFIMTSSDGLTWTMQSAPVGGISLHRAAWAEVGGTITNLVIGDAQGPRVYRNVCYEPFVSDQPNSLSICENGSAEFCIVAGGALPLSYQWQKHNGSTWQNISGAQSTCYTIDPVQVSDAGQYRCRVSNPYDTTDSDSATLTVLLPPTAFSEQPTSQSVCEFESAQFCAPAADGSDPLSYQWQHNPDSGWVNVSDATNDCYEVGSVDPADDGQYRCKVWNTCGTLISNEATLTVTARAKPDFDCDGDVDQDDFGHFQGCLTGSGIEQDDPACVDAKLDGDTDIDADDFAKFLNCLSGPGIEASVTCADPP